MLVKKSQFAVVFGKRWLFGGHPAPSAHFCATRTHMSKPMPKERELTLHENEWWNGCKKCSPWTFNCNIVCKVGDQTMWLLRRAHALLSDITVCMASCHLCAVEKQIFWNMKPQKGGGAWKKKIFFRSFQTPKAKQETSKKKVNSCHLCKLFQKTFETQSCQPGSLCFKTRDQTFSDHIHFEEHIKNSFAEPFLLAVEKVSALGLPCTQGHPSCCLPCCF